MLGLNQSQPIPIRQNRYPDTPKKSDARAESTLSKSAPIEIPIPETHSIDRYVLERSVEQDATDFLDADTKLIISLEDENIADQHVGNAYCLRIKQIEVIYEEWRQAAFKYSGDNEYGAFKLIENHISSMFHFFVENGQKEAADRLLKIIQPTKSEQK